MEIKLSENVKFEWDEHNITHIAIHNVIPEEVEEVFYQEPQIIVRDEKHSLKIELRYAFLGQTKQKRQLNIIFTLRGKNNERIRIISARDQSKKERKEYDQEVKKGSDK